MSSASGAKAKNPCVELLITAVCVVTMIVSGAAVQMVLKAQGLQEVPIVAGGPKVKCGHPYMQTIFMFIGEFLAIVAWIPEFFIKKKQGIVDELKEGKKWFKFCPHFFLFAVPTLCDLIASTLMNLGTFFMVVSVQQMIRNLYILFIAMFSSICFKNFRNNFDLPQGIGLLILVIGLMLISYSSLGFETNQAEARNNTIGIIATIIACMFSALFNVTEEIFLRRIQLSASLMVSLEGAWGLLLHIVLMPIYENVKDPFWTPGTNQTDADKPYMESAKNWYAQTKNSSLYAGLMVAQTILAMIYNVSGCHITSRVSAIARGTFVAIRVILVWIVSIPVGWEKYHP